MTNSYVEKYLEEVIYRDNSYETTQILDYPGGGPGTADVPPVHTITWTSDASAGALNLKVWESDWSRDYSLSAGASSPKGPSRPRACCTRCSSSPTCATAATWAAGRA